MDKTELFSIRQMIELTGLSEFTIRGWENRYAAFKPHRSDTGRREYSKIDIERALLLRELLKRGHRISKIAKLNFSKLQSLFESSDMTYQAETTEQQQNKNVSLALELTALQKWSELSELFSKIPKTNPSTLIHEFILPLLGQLSVLVESGLISIAQEHILSSLLKEKLHTLISNLQPSPLNKISNKNKIKFVLAAPEGDHHDIGLILAHLMIREKGLNTLYLGPHTPAQELSETALRYGASHVLIVSNISKKEGASQDPLNFISEVQKKIGSHLQILLAGRQALNFKSDLKSGFLNFTNFNEFETYLNKLSKTKSKNI